MNIVAEGINDAWLQVVKALEKAQEYSPRGLKIREVLNMSVEIKDPRKRVLSLPIRNISLPFEFGELCWYLSARNDVGMMEYYSKKMSSFSDDGETLNSAYGYRIFGHHKDLPFNQWEHVVNQLKADRESRQAVIHLHTPNDKKTKDEVCTLGLQFLIRDGKLDMIVNMRSNDIVWGFTYDVFSFTTFQELMANELEVEVGTYYHNAASMHIYEKDFGYFDHLEIFDELMYMTKYDTRFDFEGITIHDPEWENLFANESIYRTKPNGPLVALHIENNALKTMNETLFLYRVYKVHGKQTLSNILLHDNIYHIMMRNYISRKTLKDSALVIVDGCDGAGKTTFIDSVLELGFQELAFASPSPDFNRLVYFNTALTTGHLILDRFFISEIVYSRKFKRTGIISVTDVDVLERLLNYREAEYIFMNTDPVTCHSRLDETDSKMFELKDIAEICDAYEMAYRVSNIKRKRRVNN